MRLNIYDNMNGCEWDELVTSVGGTIFHSNAWRQYNNADNVTPQFIMLTSDTGTLLGAALGFKSYSPKKIFKPFTSRLWFDAVPAIRSNDEDELLEFLQLLKRHALNSGIMEMSIGSFASSWGSNLFERLNFSIKQKRFEFIIHLDKSEDDLWMKLEGKRRRNIKKAKRLGVTIQDLPGKEGLHELSRLQNESNIRILKRGGPDLTRKCQKMLKSSQTLLESSGRVVGAKVNKKTVGACLITCFNNMAYYMSAGFSQKGLETQAGTLMLWECIKYYRNKGIKIFNLGGCGADAVSSDSPEHGLFVFKKAFGAECLECANSQIILRPINYKAIKILKSIVYH